MDTPCLVQASAGEATAADQYLNPAFKFNEEDHQAVLRETENIDLVLKGERGNEVRPVLCELIGEPIKQSAELIGKPIKGWVKTGTSQSTGCAPPLNAVAFNLYSI